MTSMAAKAVLLDTPSVGPPDNTFTMAERWIAVHPLSLVGMADQYTRTVAGGSLLSVTEPVVGLLLGTSSTSRDVNRTTGTPVTVTHAAEVSVGRDALIARKQHVMLHQAVFPHHTVVGWYRVVSTTRSGDASSPTPDDLLVTQQLANECSLHQQAEMSESGNDGKFSAPPSLSAPPFLFALLLVEDETNGPEKEAKVDADDNEDDDDDGLPLKLFALNKSEQVLIGLDQEQAWSLATADPERIAVERALREKKDMTASDGDTLLTMAPVRHSLQAIQDRLDVLIHYLQVATVVSDTGRSGCIPWDHETMRRIHGVLLQAGILGSSDAIFPDSLQARPMVDEGGAVKAIDEEESMALLLHEISTLSTTVATVLEYTDNVRTLQADKQMYHQQPYASHSANASSMRSSGRSLFPSFK